jgi:hypothetical protein
MELQLGPRVCAAIDALDLAGMALLTEVRMVARSQYRDATQLQTSSQRLRFLAEACAARDRQLRAVLDEVSGCASALTVQACTAMVMVRCPHVPACPTETHFKLTHRPTG